MLLRRSLVLAIILAVLVLTTLSCTAPDAGVVSPGVTQPETMVQIAPSSTHSPTPSPTQPPPTSTSTATSTPTVAPAPTQTSTPTITPIPSEFIDVLDIPMVLVPAGEFVMGRNDMAGVERPAHTVLLDAFYIDRYEVTNEWYAVFLNDWGNQFEGLANWVEANDPDLHVHEIDGLWQVDPGFENYPMNEMTWYGARAFCEWRGAHLPTEAQWEKAARGTDQRSYPWGEGITCEMANYAGCVYDAVPVDSYPNSISPYGAYNMAGNMMEWVNDRYDIEYYANSPEENPPGPNQGDFRIIRGGSWINHAGNLRTTHRYPKLPVLTYTSVGFRCARDIIP